MRQNLKADSLVNVPLSERKLLMSVVSVVVLLIGLCAGIMVGLLGIGGGIVLVPALVHLLHMDQHAAQGTSLFVLLPPIGLGALLEYRKKGDVDFRAGILCALGMLIGGYLGGRIAVPMSSDHLKQLFGAFLMFSAFLLWSKASKKAVSAQSSVSTEGGS
jgi:uncharacterized membrane protein YfcA